MKYLRDFVMNVFVGGLLVVLPIYLTVLLLLKGMQAVVGVVEPATLLLPEWLPAEKLLSLLVVLAVCFAIGFGVRMPTGRAIRQRLEVSIFGRLPVYGLLSSLTQQMAGRTDEKAWKPALAEIEDGLVPAFIVEEHDDGRYTIFVPAVPTPLTGAIYVLDRSRVHPIDVTFTQAVRAVSQWGCGAKDLVAMMKRPAT